MALFVPLVQLLDTRVTPSTAGVDSHPDLYRNVWVEGTEPTTPALVATAPADDGVVLLSASVPGETNR